MTATTDDTAVPPGAAAVTVDPPLAARDLPAKAGSPWGFRMKSGEEERVR